MISGHLKMADQETDFFQIWCVVFRSAHHDFLPQMQHQGRGKQVVQVPDPQTSDRLRVRYGR